MLLIALATACGGGSDADSEAMPEEVETGTVTIVAPAQGSEVAGPTVTVELESTVPIVPAGTMTAGTGHHHLYLDADVTEGDVPIPSVSPEIGMIIHMGDASSTYTFENVASGEHRLIAVVADGAHVPLQPWVADTVVFTVR